MVPFRLWVIPNTPLFRVELPSLELTTPTEWLFDDKISSLPVWTPYQPDNTLYALSIAAFPPTCKGTDLYQFVQNDKYPYNTDYVVLGAFLENKQISETGFLKGRQVDELFFFTYSIPNTKLLYFWAHLDMYNVLSYRLEIDPDINNKDRQWTTRGKYIHNSLYPFTKEMNYWKQTTESFCIPTSEYKHNDRMYSYTLKECQEKAYPTIRNRHTWVGTNSEPLFGYMNWWNKQSSDKQLKSLMYK
jgi:hypothetical protein